jgi:hypothetical protein
MALRKVVSGGQTGADQAGLRAAKAAGIETGGWAPKGWETEEGPASWLGEYGLTECPKEGYPARTDANARDSDATLWFGSSDSSGYRATIRGCRRHKKPYLLVEEGITRPSEVRAWLEAHQVETLNVAGNRESKNPGLGERVETFLARLFSTHSQAPDTEE